MQYGKYDSHVAHLHIAAGRDLRRCREENLVLTITNACFTGKRAAGREKRRGGLNLVHDVL